MKFEAKGSFRESRRVQNFTKVFDVASEKLAREKVYSHFGSNHKIKRKFIVIDSIQELKNEKEKGKQEA